MLINIFYSIQHIKGILNPTSLPKLLTLLNLQNKDEHPYNNTKSKMKYWLIKQNHQG